MFANLKNKLIEEVKSSKLQQFANAAQAAVSSSTSGSSSSADPAAGASTTASHENFFSITEEDTPQNSPTHPIKAALGGGRARQSLHNGSVGGGAIPRTRKLSNSSMASDISFRLPAYESPAVYHLQSDWEASGSEMDDSASTAQLDVITKEQLFDAYRKSLERYHKYRSRYSDLAKKYKDLERDSTRARSVLVETQEKAMRRINELREQCTLEQQAKAHLEEALRVEMDDLQCQLETYQTKVRLLGESPLISFTTEDTVSQGSTTPNGVETPTITPSLSQGSEDAATRIAELENELQKRDAEVQGMRLKMSHSTNTIEGLRQQEEENVLLLAQTKQAIHAELEAKEREVQSLSLSVKQLQSELQTAKKAEEEVKKQAEELQTLRDRLKHLQDAKQEADAKVLAKQHMVESLKEQFAAIEAEHNAAESKIADLTEQFVSKSVGMDAQNTHLSKMIKEHEETEVALNAVKSALKDAQAENGELRQKIDAMEREAADGNNELALLREQFGEARVAHEEMVASLDTNRQRIAALQQELTEERALKEELANKRSELEELARRGEDETSKELRQELEDVAKELEQREGEVRAMAQQVADKEREVKALDGKLAKQRKQHESQQARIQEQCETIESLRQDVGRHEEHLASMEATVKEREAEMAREKDELQSQLTSIVQEIDEMSSQMRVVQESHTQLEAEKLELERNIERMSVPSEREDETNAQMAEKLEFLERKLQHVESENSQLAEENCLHAESKNRWTKRDSEREREQEALEAVVQELRFKLEASEEVVQRLNEKMSQVLDENSRLHNAQELMDHDLRTLQDKCDALEKEKVLAEDGLHCLEEKVAQLQEQKVAAETIALNRVGELRASELRADQLTKELRTIGEGTSDMEHELKELRAMVKRNETALQNEQKWSELLQAKQTALDEASAQHAETLGALKAVEEAQQREMLALTEQLRSANVDLATLRQSKDTLEAANDEEMRRHREELTELEQRLAQQAADYERASQQLRTDLDAALTSNQEDNELKAKLQSLQCEFYVLQEGAAEHDAALTAKDCELQAAQKEVETLRDSLATERSANEREASHTKFIAEQNDAIQKELLRSQQQLVELEQQRSASSAELAQLRDAAEARQAELTTAQATIEGLRGELTEKIQELEERPRTQTPTGEAAPTAAEHLRQMNATLQGELEDLKHRSTAEIADLQQEIEDMQNNSRGMAERIMELEKLRASLQEQKLIDGFNLGASPAKSADVADWEREKAAHDEKLAAIMGEVREVSDRNRFLEQQVEAYLVLEQSNERLKLQNAKLARQLDETLVSMQHSEGVTANTEFEYLKNIMFQYLTGSANGNNETLVKVISAVLKFSPQQTQVALEKEHQRRSLLNKIL